MFTNKKFNEWIRTNFKGLSAKTLKQLVMNEYMLPVEHVDNMVYVNLFNVFTGSRSDKDWDVFLFCKNVVYNCDWL